MAQIYSLALVGARGHTGRELLRIIARHPQLQLAYAISREFAGRPVSSVAPEIENVTFCALNADEVAKKGVDIVILAMPDGAAADYVAAIESYAPNSIIVDLSADYRFDDAWVYGLPERNRSNIAGAKRIANPGCYATAMQLAIAPVLDNVDGIPIVFGVSGYSGAGTKPSPKNDVERLRDNLMPYKLHGHNHEREATRHLNTPIRFMPHVHPAFSGIITTINIPLKGDLDEATAKALYAKAYAHEPLIQLQDHEPELRDGTGNIGVTIGGITLSQDRKHLAVIAAEDNLLKGAAIQAIQNINLALGLNEWTALEP
jgi:N-acetyl-gamma-glutamyl-phosphate reductase common form